QLIVVERGSVRTEAVGVGTIESEVVVDLSFTAQGRITELGFREGDVIRAGDVVARIDVATLEKQRAVAKAGIALSGASLAKAEAELARAHAGQEAAARELQRAEVLAG